MTPDQSEPLDDTALEDAALDDAALDAALAADDGALGLSLRALLDPPDDIERRTAHSVDRSLRGRSALGLGLDLLGVGWRTVTTILTDDPSPADGVPEGNHDED